VQDTCEINEECAPVLARNDILMLSGGPLQLGFYVAFVSTNIHVSKFCTLFFSANVIISRFYELLISTTLATSSFTC